MSPERLQMMDVSIRKFEKKDIPNKVKWINDPQNNAFLHYDLPLDEAKTERWFEANKDRLDRYDAIVEMNGVAVGIIGLLSIDRINKKAEYYVTIGERAYLGKGIAGRATRLLLEYAFDELSLNRVYLYTEVDNVAAIKLYERIGFRCEGLLKNDLFFKGRYVDRYIYGITKKDFYHCVDTPIHMLSKVNGNNLYVKREDFIPYSFGGNKARKALLFFEQIDQGGYDCVVTYGSSSSNHCRVIANMAAERNMPCYIISPEEASKKTYNSEMMNFFGANFIVCPITEVYNTIEKTLADLKSQSCNPYFIEGGGHGNIGTQAYVDCYEEIRRFEKAYGLHFDYIFHATGTGTTQAGLVCGQLIDCDERKIVGISIARINPRGRDVVRDSIVSYLSAKKIDVSHEQIENAIMYVDDYVGEGYGVSSSKVKKSIAAALRMYGIPFDSTYTGKAFDGMLDYIDKMCITKKNVLFIHTGGTPLFFDEMRNFGDEV